MSTTITVDSIDRIYEDSELARYAKRLQSPGNGLGTTRVPASTNLPEEGVTSHLLKSVSAAGDGQRASSTLRDVIPNGDGTSREVTIVINVYQDGTHEEDIDRAGAMLSGQVASLVASDCAELKDMAQLGKVNM
jgi:hypothetical protein